MRSSIFDDRRFRIGAIVLSGVLCYFATGLNPLWWTAWLFPIPVLAASFSASAGEGFLLGFFSAGLGELSMFTYYQIFAGLGGSIAILSLNSLVFGLVVMGTRRIVRSTRSWLVVLFLPTLLASIDTLVGQALPNGTAPD